MHHPRVLTTAILFAFGTGACAQYTRQTAASDNTAAGTSAPAVVNVTNNNMQDVEVFLNQSKFVQRLGSVGTGQVGTLEIPVRELKNRNDITLTVKLVGGAPSNGSYVTQPLLVHPGDEFNLTVAPVLEHSRLER